MGLFSGSTQRQRRILWAILATLVGTAALTVLVLMLRRMRDTDLAEAGDQIKSEFKNLVSANAPKLRFTNVGDALGIRMQHGANIRRRILPEDTGSGLAWGDFDGDGDPDLYVVSLAAPGEKSGASTNHLFRNDNVRFTDVTAKAGVADPLGIGMGASFADYDNDGDLDLYVTNHGADRLFRNNGDGTFTDVARAAGVTDELWSTGAAWGDFDRDGHLDLYVCNYIRHDDDVVARATAAASGREAQLPTAGGPATVPWTLNPSAFDPVPNRLYRNNGNGTFTDVAETLGVADKEGRSLAATFADLDGDGWLDLYINNDASPNSLYRNHCGDATGADDRLQPFADLSTMSGTADPRASMGLSLGEVGWMIDSADDLPDMFLTHWVAQEDAFYVSVMMPGGVLEYRDKSRQFGLGEISIDTVGWGSTLADFDLDGRQDLAVANGSTLERRDDARQLLAEPMFLYWNEGRRFVNLAASAGPEASASHNARGLAAADFDNDGDVDLAINVNRGQPLLLRNDTEQHGHSLTVVLDAPHALCIGARIEAVIAGKKQIRWIGADVSFLSQHDSRQTFGLGTVLTADKLTVRFLDGTEVVETHVPAGRATVRHPRTPAWRSTPR